MLTAIAFDEHRSATLAQELNAFARLISSNLREAELRAAFVREGLRFSESAIRGIGWILPHRALAPEFATVLDRGYLRGFDLWHIATALYVSPDAGNLAFAALDSRQRAAVALGFAVPWNPESP